MLMKLKTKQQEIWAYIQDSVLVALVMLLLAMMSGCEVPPYMRRKAAPPLTNVEQFRLLDTTKVYAQHLRAGSTVELTLPRGCVVTVQAQPRNAGEPKDAPRVRVLACVEDWIGHSSHTNQ
jgi:hypothetical protein